MPLRARLREQIFPFLIGALIALVPIVLFAARNPTAFYFGVLQFHSSPPPEWLTLNLPQTSSLQILKNILMSTPISIVVVLSCLLVLWISLYRSGERPLTYFYRNGQWLFPLILLAGIPVCMMPSPSYKWYFIPIVPFLILCFASLLSYPIRNELVRYSCLAVAVLACIPNFLGIASRYLALLSDPSKWRPVAVHRASVRLDEILDETKVPGKVATLSPSRVLDTKRDFYLELSTAWAFFPRAVFLPKEEVQRLHGTSPATLPVVFENDMPAAIFGGYEETSGDIALFDFARANGYRRVEDKAFGRGILFVREPQESEQN
jgi:hypothetical protein